MIIHLTRMSQIVKFHSQVLEMSSGIIPYIIQIRKRNKSRLWYPFPKKALVILFHRLRFKILKA